jgi:hypothetical protein
LVSFSPPILYASLGQKDEARKEFDKTKELQKKKDVPLIEIMPDSKADAK